MPKHTSVNEFLLLGITDTQELEHYLFVVFLIIYNLILIGNGAILVVVISEPQLHSPMYFFLGNLSCLDICYSTVTLPKMLDDFLSTHKTISFVGCITQLHFFHFFGSTEAILVGVMAFDCFVAICNLLHYMLLMKYQVCLCLAAVTWITGFFHALLHSVMTSHLTFCGSNHIHHFFCDIKPLLDLAYGNTELNHWMLETVTGTIAISTFFFILLSYFYIISFLLFKSYSCSMLQKALSTCASHFIVVSVFYVPVAFTYIHPSSGSSMDQDQIVAIMYSVITPVLNSLVYTSRNKDVKGALRKAIRKELWPAHL
ncbi:olfactory receptor 12D2-like [Phascolarctos cinereus]|uniref:Olfactory receptor 12D2-like n=1 Tax=Phascolarctos cinereus TaxID=38626 RepID=A0A6P5JJZ8_PHACI|nr:olfactory receptor 12D2-like [Phascolarctos cinereus]